MYLAHGPTNELADWRPLLLMLGAYLAVCVGLFAAGRATGSGATQLVARISAGLRRVTRIPGWAAASVGTATFGLLVAGMGFYNDVAWHVRLGRDKELFTAPHTAIVVGLFLIFSAAVTGTLMASIDRAETALRFGPVRVPWSMIVLGLLGGSALVGFPIDDLWHRTYGIDVTMWSPSHLLMIVGASLSPLASWLALGEAKVRPADSKWAGGLHIAVGCIALLGLSSVQGEFEFGVPQFQQLYHPVLFALAAGFALTAIALVVRRWWAPLVVAGVGLLLAAGPQTSTAANGQPRSSSLYIGSALVVALVGRIVGTDRRLRLGIAAGLAIGTAGLASEWAWSRGGYQPWGWGLVPEGPALAIVAAVAAAVLGAAFATAVRGEARTIPVRAIAAAGAAVLFVLAWPLPRRGTEGRADLHLVRAPGGVTVEARVSPSGVVRHARWFQVIAWQGGGFVRAEMVPTGDAGEYRSERAVPVGGKWKTMLRLQRGAEMSAIPVWLPADPEIGAPEVAAVDRSAPFRTEQRYLLREQHPGPPWLARGVYLLLALIAALWVTTFAVAARAVGRADGARVPEGGILAAT